MSKPILKTEIDEVCDWCPGETDECKCQRMVCDGECPLFSDEEGESRVGKTQEVPL